MALLVNCVSQKKAEYELPDQMLPHVKVEYAKQCEKGQELYSMSCAKCHNERVGLKKVIPDFTQEQLTGYTIRETNPKHRATLQDTLVTTEELNYIMTFLMYKKKSGVAMSPKK